MIRLGVPTGAGAQQVDPTLPAHVLVGCGNEATQLDPPGVPTIAAV